MCPAMKIGIQIPNFTFPKGPSNLSSDLKSIATFVDKSGFSSLWVMDHFFQIGQAGSVVGPAEEDMHEGYTTLGFLAAITQNVKLGTMVTGNIYRNPGILVKTVTTLDVLSKGRAYFGLGAGWFERETVGLGAYFPPLKERFERLEETILIAKQMWSGKVSEFHGKFHHLKETLCSPMPIQKPHPPLLIGGSGPKKTLKLVAKYGDACNLFARAGTDAVKGSLEILQKHCERLGRDYNRIEKTSLMTASLGAADTPKTVIEKLKSLAKVGIQHAIVNMRYPQEITPLQIFKDEILPAVSDL